MNNSEEDGAEKVQEDAADDPGRGNVAGGGEDTAKKNETHTIDLSRSNWADEMDRETVAGAYAPACESSRGRAEEEGEKLLDTTDHSDHTVKSVDDIMEMEARETDMIGLTTDTEEGGNTSRSTILMSVSDSDGEEVQITLDSFKAPPPPTQAAAGD